MGFRGSCLVSLGLGSEANAVIAGKPAPTGFVWYHNFAFTSAPCGSGLARDGVLETSIIIPAFGDALLDYRRIRVLSRRKLPLQAPRKRNDLGNRQIQLLRNAVPQLHARQQPHQLGIFVDRHLAVAGYPQDFFRQLFVALGGEGGGDLPDDYSNDGSNTSLECCRMIQKFSFLGKPGPTLRSPE